jgi:L-cysteine S-thiosulfotransferase
LKALARVLVSAALAAGPAAGARAQALVRYAVEGDQIRAPLVREPGDAARGRKIVLDRSIGGCVLCHAFPEPEPRFMGDIGPALAGVGARLSAAQLRLRVVDQSRIDPRTPMPSYYRTEGLYDVASAYRGKPILDAQQVEDVVSYLQTLRGAKP